MTEPSPNAGVAPPVVIRSASVADAPVLARLRYEFRAALDTPRENEDAFVARCEEWMAKRLATDAWWAWVAESHDSAIGTAWLNRVEKIPNPVGEPEAHGYLTNFYVRQDYDGLIGRDVLSHFDVVFTDSTVQLYGQHVTTGRFIGPTKRAWLPPGFAEARCTGSDRVTEYEPDSSTGNITVSMPLDVVSGRGFRAVPGLFDSGTPLTIVGWFASRAVNITPTSPEIRPFRLSGGGALDTATAGWTSAVRILFSGLAMRLDSVGVWDFMSPEDQAQPGRPRVLLGRDALRSVDVYLGYRSLGRICMRAR